MFPLVVFEVVLNWLTRLAYESTNLSRDDSCNAVKMKSSWLDILTDDAEDDEFLEYSSDMTWRPEKEDVMIREDLKNEVTER